MTLQDILNTEVVRLAYGTIYKKPSARIYCMDGSSLSVQTGDTLYCTPRDNYGPWSHVEIGFPSRHFALLEKWKEGDNDVEQCDTIFPYVPIDVANKIIEDCGGICAEFTIILNK